jgi:hypothetical protein
VLSYTADEIGSFLGPIPTRLGCPRPIPWPNVISVASNFSSPSTSRNISKQQHLTLVHFDLYSKANTPARKANPDATNIDRNTSLRAILLSMYILMDRIGADYSIGSGTDPDRIDNEEYTKPICKFYRNIYKRMRTWFGYTYPYWLSNMDQQMVLDCILRLNIAPNMYGIFINVACKIKKNNGRPIDVLTKYKLDHPDPIKGAERKIYYAQNIIRITEYNRLYNILRKNHNSSINIFKKNAPSNV